MAYKYKVYTSDKKIIQGRLDVSSENLAEGALYRAGYQQILSLEEIPQGLSRERLIPTLFGVKTQDVIDFSNQLATLIESGITLLTALRLLEGQSTKPALKKIINSLVIEIQEGNPLHMAFGNYPHVFSDTYVQVIRASAQAGNLETGLRQAASYMEKRAASHQRIKRAMLYPAFVLLIAVAVCILLIMVALPPLVDLFDSLNAELPWMTQTLITLTESVLDNIVLIIAIVALLAVSIAGLFRLPSVQLATDRLLLKLPIIGSINIERNMQHFCQTASMLLTAGLRLPQIMEIASQITRNRIIHRALNDVRGRLIQGEGLSQPMSENNIFPSLMVEMVIVGEKSGSMDSTLATLANFYERRVDRKIDALISMIEPALTLIIGIVVIFIALSMITPLYQILRSMH
jgi:type IV pilus assembly protein PilC